MERTLMRRVEGRGLRTPLVKRATLAIALLLALPGFGAPPDAAAREPVAVAGITEPVSDVTLGVTVAGTIQSLLVAEGMQVEKGALLLELDKQMEALEVTRRRLVWENDAELVAAAARVRTLRSLLEATRGLYERTASVSREELEKLALDHELAVAEQSRLQNGEERERIEYEMAREALEKRVLRSPIQGTVIKVFLDVGEACSESQPLVRIADTSRGLFVGNPEEPVGRTLKRGQQVDLSIRAGEGSVRRRGTVVYVSPVVDPASALMEVKVLFDNADGAVRPGISGVLLLPAP